MNGPLVEACVEGIDGALAAERAGADRIELCAGLAEGGLTPSIGTIRAACKALCIPVHVIIRPRGGDFLYSDAEFATMLADVTALRAEGVAGVVFGCLTPDGQIDEARMMALVAAAGPMATTCHRAFDMTSDPHAALEALINCKIGRVLTSGHRESAMDAIPLFKALHAAARGRIIVMGCGGLDTGNIAAFWQQTRLQEVHFAALRAIDSTMRYRNDGVGMGSDGAGNEYQRTITDERQMKATIEALRAAQTIS